MSRYAEPDVRASRRRGRTWAVIAATAVVIAAVMVILLVREAAGNATPAYQCVITTPATKPGR